MKNCDIIIPIYNAYDCLAPCIDSVIKNTNLEENRLILIDDKSPDERVLPLLEKYSNDKNIILLKNKVNLGFVGTVNKGMKYSDENDVLLLNSDTEVTKDWLDCIKKCAYSNERIATVTPLSNNATFASVPRMFYPNQLPEDTSLEEMSKIVKKLATNEPIEVPTGHGFCLYIKRDALKKVGFFDEKAFGKGYGEENDFCFRCISNDLINVLCDNVYILHKESQSFKESKIKLINEGLEILDKRYPDVKEKSDMWIGRSCIYDIGQKSALDFVKKSAKDIVKPNVLIIIHDWKNVPNNIGGTTLHVWDIIRNLRDKYNFHILAPEDGIYRVYSYWSKNNNESFVKYNEAYRFSDYSLYNHDYKAIVEEVIKLFKINICHIHHLKDSYFDVIDVLKEKNIYTIMTLHDFYCVCPLINKLYQERTYCGIASEEKCSNCLTCKNMSVSRGLSLIKYWREEYHKNLKKVDLLITPSEATKDEILQHYGDLKIKAIEHGVDIDYYDAKVTNDESKDFNIAFLGGIGIHKGYYILKKMVKKRNLGNIKIHLFGKSLEPIENNGHFINHGLYKREDLPRLLSENNIKLVCLFSIWPETYSYTMTESIACKVPVISYSFGAIKERIEKYNLGWLVPTDASYIDIINKIKEIENDKDEYNKVMQSINDYKIKDTKTMAKEYSKIYDKNISGKVEKIDLEKVEDHLIESTKFYYNSTLLSYSWVFKTLKWRIISKIKIPRRIKKIIKKVTGR